MKLLLSFASLSLPLFACNPHVTIDQTKPMEININITGHLDLVIHDARQDLEQITGEKPARTVRPEDIGLPAAPGGGGARLPSRSAPLAGRDSSDFMPVARVTRLSPAPQPVVYAPSAEDDLKKAMAARNSQIRALWDSKAVGECHTGLLVKKGTLTDEQQKLVDAENKDRAALYAAEAKAKSASSGKTVTDQEVALAYYVAHLGYAKTGNWYDKKKSNSEEWEWKQWGQ